MSNPISQPDNSSSVTTADSSAPAELSAVIDDLLNSLSNKFAGVSSEVFAKIDEISRRLDNLEGAIQSNIDRNSRTKSPSKNG